MRVRDGVLISKTSRGVVYAAAVGILLTAGRISAADGPPSMERPPAQVVTAHGEMGVISPQGEFPGSVYFKEVSDVATEVRGKVLEVMFEDGTHVSAGQPLVRLDVELLERELAAVKSRMERDRTLLADAEVRLKRADELVGSGLTPVEQLDSARFAVQALRFALTAAEAEVARIDVTLRKSEIVSPFDGVVIDRMTDVGEWKNEGAVIAVIARANEYEVVVDVPEMNLPFSPPGTEVELQLGGERVTATVAAVVPRGDITTRTFPVKLRMRTEMPLMEGMTARARMPIGERLECLFLHRDAVINQLGAFSVFTVQDGSARKHSVQVVGYDGLRVGVHAPELGPGQLFIVKGHEQLMDGVAVDVQTLDAAQPVPADGR